MHYTVLHSGDYFFAQGLLRCTRVLCVCMNNYLNTLCLCSVGFVVLGEILSKK